MKIMAEEMYQAERAKFPYDLVLFHDKLMVDGLYDPRERDGWPAEVLALDKQLADIYKKVDRYRTHCLDCMIACTGPLCPSTKSCKALEEEASDIEAKMKNMLLCYMSKKV